MAGRRGSHTWLVLLAVLAATGTLALSPHLAGGQLSPPSLATSPVQATSGSPTEWVEFVGRLPLSGGLHADIWAHDETAYVGTWSGACPGSGVKVVDIRDPASPALLGTLGAHPGTSAEDLVVIEARTSAFQGDLLAVGLQVCGSGGIPGVEFWDVSNPSRPARLGFLATPATIGVHELHLFQRGQQVLALLAVPHSERAGAGGDFRIVDASDPAEPIQLADWGVFRDLGLEPSEARGSFSDILAHSAAVSPDGRVAYVSYWDAGVVLLDISDPSSPRFISRTIFGPSDEGNAHSVAVSPNGQLLVQADEVTDVASLGVEISGPGAAAGTYRAVEASFTPRLSQTGGLEGRLVYLGNACPGEEASPAADTRGGVALVDRGDCPFSSKILHLEQAGAAAVIVANNVDGLPIPMGTANLVQPLSIPAVMISQQDGASLKGALDQGKVLTVALGGDVRADYRDWGYLRFFDVSNLAQPRPISTFATARALNEPSGVPPDDGEYSVHNPLIVGDRLYASWFSDGLRVIDLSDPARPTEVAAFVPPAHPDPSGLGLKPDQPMVWGVAVHGDLLLLSDMNFGLYVLRHVRAEQGSLSS